MLTLFTQMELRSWNLEWAEPCYGSNSGLIIGVFRFSNFTTLVLFKCLVVLICSSVSSFITSSQIEKKFNLYNKSSIMLL